MLQGLKIGAVFFAKAKIMGSVWSFDDINTNSNTNRESSSEMSSSPEVTKGSNRNKLNGYFVPEKEYLTFGYVRECTHIVPTEISSLSSKSTRCCSFAELKSEMLSMSK